MRVMLVGTEMAAVRPGSGALEMLLCGWAAGLAGGHEVTVVSVPGPPPDPANRYRTLTFDRPADLAAIVGRLDPAVVVLDNRPGWQRWVDAPTLHLLHNWPDAWQLPPGRSAGEVIGGAGVAAVSCALAATVATTTGRTVEDVSIVRPFVDPGLLDVELRPEPGLVVSPNRLLVKKGVRELSAAAGHPAMRSYRVQITDHLSPWTSPTDEHRRLRAAVARSRAELIPPPVDRSGMAALYARADVVVCPSIRPEGLGLTALEAQAVGVPVVSSGLGGLTEACLLPALTADPHDPRALAAAIGAAAALDGDARRALRTRARRTWSIEASCDSLLGALRRTLASLGAAPPA